VKISGVHQPDGPAFDVVLILHVGCVVAGLATLVASTSAATSLRRLLRESAPFSDAVVRYFRPGVNWAGRAVWGIPVFGFALLALSHGAYSLKDGWVMGGLAIFVALALLAEGVLWPAERRLQVSLIPLTAGGIPVDDAVRRDVRAMAGAAGGALALLVAGSVLMLVQP
jgi:hypothetical protein